MLKSLGWLPVAIVCTVTACVIATSSEYGNCFPDVWWGNLAHDIAWAAPGVLASVGVHQLYLVCTERTFGSSVIKTLWFSVLAGGITFFIQVAFHGYRVLFAPFNVRTERELLVFSFLLAAYIFLGAVYAWFMLKVRPR